MCLSVSMALCGAFPLVALLSRALAKPLDRLGRTLGVNAVSMTGLVAALATNLTSLGLMRDMNDRGVLLNAAFAVSGAFTFAAHMAFTLAFDPAWLPAVMAGKLSAGVLAVGLALLCAPKWIRNI